MTTACPTPDQLRNWLNAALVGTEQSEVTDHIDGCLACQAALDQITHQTAQFGPTPGGSGTQVFLTRVQASPPLEITARPSDGPLPLPRLPGYVIEEEIGRGGMGVVYRARHIRLNRTVALKMLNEYGASDPSIRGRFLVEAEAVAQLSHPHVVQVYEFGESGGRPYIAMEYVAGGNLANRLANGPRLTPAQAASLMSDLADAVAMAHRKGIIHRDLKPSNVLLDDAADGSGDPIPGAAPAPFRPKITDFGIARVGLSSLTATGEVLGTPSYMSPEQAAGRTREVGTATDVYGLGAILYELLAGRPPFVGETAIDTLQQVVHNDPRPPRSVISSVPRDLDTICQKCLAKDPSKRYASPDALATDLRAFLSSRPIAARPVPTWEWALRFARRNPSPTAALALVVCCIVGAFLWVNAARMRAESDRLKAETATTEKEAALVAAEAGRAEALFNESISRCENGDITAGLVGLEDVKAFADRRGDPDLARVAAWNIRAWAARRPTVIRALDRPNPACPLTCAAFADEGRVAVTGSSTGMVRVWPTDGGQPWDIPAPEGAVTSVVGVFPVTQRRLRIVYASGVITEWDLGSQSKIGEDRAFQFASPVRSAGVTIPPRVQSGELIAAGSHDGIIQIWDTVAKKLLVGPDDKPDIRQFFRGPKKRKQVDEMPPTEADTVLAPVTGVGFSESGNLFLTAGEDEGVILLGLPVPKTGRFFDPFRDGKPDPGVPYHQFDLGGPVFALAITPDRQGFLAGGAAGVSLWSIHDRDRPIWSRPHPDRVGALAFVLDRRICASGDQGGNVQIRDTATGNVLSSLVHPGPIAAIDFHPKTRDLVLVAGRDGSAVLWQLPPRAATATMDVEPTPSGPGVVIPVGPRLTQAVSVADFDLSRSGYWAVTPDGLTLWPGNRYFPFPPPPAGAGKVPPNGAILATDGSWAALAVAGTETTWVSDLSELPKRTGLRLSAGVDRMWACDTRLIYPTRPEWKPFPARAIRTGNVTQLGRLPDRAFFTVTTASDRTQAFTRWDVGREGAATRGPSWSLPEGAMVSPHPDGKSILVGGRSGSRLGFRDAVNGREVGLSFPEPGTVTALAVDPSGKWVATGGSDGSVRVWSTSDGVRVGRPFFHADRVNAVAFGNGPSSGVIATASSDGTARFHDIATGLPLGPPLRHSGAILTIAFHPSGESIITGDRTGSATVWPIPR